MAAPENTDDTWRTVDAVQTSCDILDALRELDGAGITELATHLGIAKGTVHSHLATLRQNEYVVKDGDTYRISLRFLDFGKYAKHSVESLEIVKNELDKASQETGEVAQFMVEEHGQGVYLYKSRGEAGVETASYVGRRMHLNCTAIGKAILASLNAETVERIIARHGLPRQTENTITDRDELYDELDRIRADGFATDDEEILTGLRCVAAPITTENKELLGAISISGPTSRITGRRFEKELPESVRRIANVIEINIAQRARQQA